MFIEEYSLEELLQMYDDILTVENESSIPCWAEDLAQTYDNSSLEVIMTLFLRELVNRLRNEVNSLQSDFEELVPCIDEEPF